MHLSIIIPAYNEIERIGNTLKAIDEYLKKQSYDYEILVVDDGSKDETARVVQSLIGDIPNLRLIDNKENRGKGAVVKQGMLAAQGDFRLFIDADNAISIEQIETFWPWLEKGYDIIIGSIEVSGAKIEEKAGWHRRILGKLSKYLIRILAIWEIHDTQRAFKLFPAKAVQDIFQKQTIERWGFDIEILVIAKKLGYKIKELPVTWINPAGSKVTLKSYFNTLKELLKIKWNLLSGRYHR
ncbi:MAG: glycosyltransferase family 2 protein [bacterium]|nr:glycosyltransferase family 2 protein [bacterium]